MKKEGIPTIAKKNRIINNIIRAIISRDHFLIIGHKNPDEDCIASMVAFGLLLSKFSKSAYLVIRSEIHQHFQYLFNICRYNSIEILEQCRKIPENISTAIFLDTPKPSMLEDFPGSSSLLSDRNILKIEIDHHLEADSDYIGDNEYCLVDEASSTSELIGLFGFKLKNRNELLETYQIPDLFSRNFVLAILTGIIGDSKMGKYLKTNREKWFYRNFSNMFNDMLFKKTHKSSKNFSTMKEVFTELEKLSEKEDACYKYMIKKKDSCSSIIRSVVLKPADMEYLNVNYDHDTIITVARYTADRLAEESRYLSLVVYYDDPNISNLIQFRMRRSQSFKKLDLRKILDNFSIENGGGHPGAIGFRIDRDVIKDIDEYVNFLISGTEALVKETKQA